MDYLFKKKKKFIPFHTEADSFLINNQIYNAALTANGNFVFATQRGGIAIIDHNGKLLKIINEDVGLPTNVIYDVYPDINGGIWLASEYGIIYCKEETSISIFKNTGKLKSRSYAVTRFNGTIYLANELGVLYLKNNKDGFQLVKGSNKPAYAFLGSNQFLFAGTNYGLAKIEDYTLKQYIMEESSTALLSSKVFPGRFYSLTGNGYAVIEKQKDNNFKVTYLKEMGREATSIVEEADGSIWVEGYFEGLYHIHGNMNELSSGSDKNIKYDYYTNKTGLPGNTWVLNKIHNRFLLSTDKGVFSFDKESKTFIRDVTLGSPLSDSTTIVSLINEGRNDEFWILANIKGKYSLGKAIRTSSGNINWEPIPELWNLDLESVKSIYSDIDLKSGNEKLWVSTNEGLVLYDPTVKMKFDSEYSTIIRKVIVNGNLLKYAGAQDSNDSFSMLSLPFSNNNIAFEYSAPTYDKPNSTLFQFFLEGVDKGWSTWTNETKKEFTNLAHGDYKFHLRAKNIYGVIGRESQFKFTILAPWYSTWWAYVLYIIAAGAILYSIRKFELNRKEKNNTIRLSQLRAEAAEYQSKVAESQARIIQADNDRKTKELDEARNLQLSMLPKVIPLLSNLEIAVYMKTATEVGGDYYDFSTKEDGSLNVCVGDATGHGMKAGTLVSMMKSLFTANSVDKSLEEFFKSSNNALKNSKLEKMMMALGMLNISGYKVRISNAGIPPIYIYRNNKKAVEEIMVNGMPLGAMKNSKYEVYESGVEKGDLIILLSDGFPELKNANGEMYGYERLKNTIEENADFTPNEFIKRMINEGFNWSQEVTPDDDITFVVIKVK